MPRRKWTPKKRLQPDYVAERDDLYLETGADYFDDSPLARNEELARAVWQEHGREILQRYMAQRPGRHRRPWAWWQFDAPEPRRRIGGTGTPLNSELSFGTPAAYDGDYDDDDPPQYESETDYLRRLNLLTAEEINSCAGMTEGGNDNE